MQVVRKIKTMWRNASILMLINGQFKYRPAPRHDLGSVLDKRTLPIFLENTDKHCKDETDLLFVQRHDNSGFMASAHVFPGGVLDEADYSPNWLNLFGELNRRTNKDLFTPFLNLRDSSAPRLPLYDSIPGGADSLRGEIAFRICAIRETFEEAGVLLVREHSDIDAVLDRLPGSFKPSVKLLPDALREQWRKRVHNNAHEFITMCRELECVPDIWSLIEWSNWLTPRNHNRRYDTVFYMCFVESKPPSSPDGEEVNSAIWFSPDEAIQKLTSQEIFLPPPQLAELKGLEGFSDSCCLHSYALSRMISGGSSDMRSHVRLGTKDGYIISVGPFDDLFPVEGSEDRTTEIQHPKSLVLRDRIPLVLSQRREFELVIPSHTAQELRELSQNMSRMEFKFPREFMFFDNQYVEKTAEYHTRYTQQLVDEQRTRSKL